jgi:hypothetical protein
MRLKNSQDLFSYWDRMRAGRRAPSREEIEPSDIRNLLADTFILDISRVHRAISYRLAGTRLCTAYGRELKGLGFLVNWREEDAFQIAQVASRVFSDFQPYVISYTGETESGRIIEYEMLMLPLLPMEDGSARILGVASPTTLPFWLGVEPLAVNRLNSVRPIQKAARSGAEAPPLAHSGTGSHLPSAKEPGNRPRKVAHLTVLDGGRKA